MKKLALAMLLVAFVIVSLVADTQQPDKQRRVAADPGKGQPAERTRIVPEWEWVTTPQNLITNFYDYMPGSYSKTPLRVQKNLNGDVEGLYLAFHGRETAASTRRTYWSYVNGEGAVSAPIFLTGENIHEGYPTVAIDPMTMDPFFCWHIDIDEDGITDVSLVYDNYALLGQPGLLSSQMIPLDHTNYAGTYTPEDDDEFIWPKVYISKAPSFDVDGKRRLYIFADNYVTHGANPSENVLLAYVDFDDQILNENTLMDQTWHYQTFELLDNYNHDNPQWGRFQKGIDVTWDGKVIMMGYLNLDVEPADSPTADVLVFYNDNFAEGDWQVNTFDFFDLAEMHPPEGWFTDVDESYARYFDFGASSHFSTVMDRHDNAHALMGMQLGYTDDAGDSYIWEYYACAKVLNYNPTTNSIYFYDLDPTGANPGDGNFSDPWDQDEDGNYDVDEDGDTVAVVGWNVWYHEWDTAFHENTYKMSTNTQKNWMAAVWHDGLGNKYAQAGIEGYASWLEKPEIRIALSADNGLNWSEAITMHANSEEDGYVAELDGQIPVYIYPSDYIEDLGNEHGLIHLMYLDDYSFGSYIQSVGPNDGGMMKYASIDVDFSQLPTLPPDGTEDNTTPSLAMNLGNYPNPFNPTTNIQFNLNQDSNVELKIYNVRGELVKTVFEGQLQSGKHVFTWKGTDSNNQSVASGVYFVRVNDGRTVETNKMMLLK